MMMLRFGKADCSYGFVAVILFVVNLSMACGRSGMLPGPDEEGEGVSGTNGPDSPTGGGGRSGGTIAASLGGAGAGGSSKVSSSGGASASSISASKPFGGGSGGSGGASTVLISSTKPFAGAGAIGGASSAVGGVSVLAGSKASGGAVGGVSVLAGSKASGGAVGGVSALAGSKASGGASAIGGSTSTLSCTDAKVCGGDVVGTWNVTSSCLTVSGQMDISTSGLGCSRAAVDGSLQTTGMWIAKPNGVYSDKTITSGNLQISLPASCLKVSGTTIRCKDALVAFMSLGFRSITCNDATGGGCTCPAVIQQSGSMGVISPNPWTSGVYETNGNTMVIDSTNRYSYCVSGTQMTLTPQGKNPPTTGAIVFQKAALQE
jgi:hypothetical protein